MPGDLRRSLAGLAGAAALAIASVATAAGPKLLPAEQAFRLSARALDAKTVEVRYNVADGYYLYRDKLGFTVEPPPSRRARPRCLRASRTRMSSSARSRPTGDSS